jgi:large exoprotein involved in heme utilization and adhesion
MHCPARSAPTRRLKARSRMLAAAIAACYVTAPAWALPTNPVVANGSASFAQTGGVLNVTNSNGAVINWNSFNIAAGETTRFIQPAASSSVP